MFICILGDNMMNEYRWERRKTASFQGKWCEWCTMDIIAQDLWVVYFKYFNKGEIMNIFCIPCGILIREGKI